MNICRLRHLKIGEGKPKVCLPIVSHQDADILCQIQDFQKYTYDMIELRIDFYQDIHDEQKVLSLLQQVRLACSQPILLTYRSLREGGQIALSDEDYLNLVRLACQSQCIDMIDIELMSGKVLVCQMTEIAHSYGVKVLMSYHCFTETPPLEDMKRKLEDMELLGADIAKMAVMPLCQKDVWSLLELTKDMSAKLSLPLVTISMGKLGKISRIIGELTGSCITFASGGQNSAPGQIDVKTLNELLEVIHDD